jgi:signal peptidase II
VTALAADLISKEVVFSRLGLFGRTRWLIDSWLRFELATNLNPGALWGIGQGLAPVFALISAAAFAGIVYWLFFRGAASSMWLTFALGLVSGGTLGNLYDRLGLHGISLPNKDEPALAVRDFLHFQFGDLDWAIFNIADTCLVLGAIMLLLQSFRQPENAT